MRVSQERWYLSEGLHNKDCSICGSMATNQIPSAYTIYMYTAELGVIPVCVEKSCAHRRALPEKVHTPRYS